MTILKSFSELKVFKTPAKPKKEPTPTVAEVFPEKVEAEEQFLPPVNENRFQSDMVRKDKELLANFGKVLLKIESSPREAANLLGALKRRWPKGKSLELTKAFNYLNQNTGAKWHKKAKLYIEEASLFVQNRLDKNYGVSIERFLQAVDLPLEGKPVVATSPVLVVFGEIPKSADLQKIKASCVETCLYRIAEAHLIGVPIGWSFDKIDKHLSQYTWAVYKHLPMRRSIGSYVWYLATKKSFNITHLLFPENLSSRVSPELLEQVYGTSEVDYKVHVKIANTRKKILQEKQRMARLTFGADHQEKYQMIRRLQDQIAGLRDEKLHKTQDFTAKHSYKPSALSNHLTIFKVAEIDYAERVAGIREQTLRDQLKQRCHQEAKMAFREAKEISKISAKIAERKALLLSLKENIESDRQDANSEL